MRPLALYSIIFLSMVSACKKSSISKPPDQIERSIFYKVVATLPSPADSARAVFADSILLTSVSTNNNDPTYLTNFPGISAQMAPSGSYFSIKYKDDSKPFPYFSFSNSVFQNIPENPELKKVYEFAYGPTLYPPIVLSTHDGSRDWNYFINDVYPGDALKKSLDSNYTKIYFTRLDRYDKPGSNEPIWVADGELSGYKVLRYSNDPEKYVHRLDFTVKFTGVIVDR